MAEPEANISERRRVSAIWLVPIVALLLGAWMVIHTLQNQGPEIRIVFDSGAGIEAGKTKIKVLDVQIGLVTSVGLADDLERVVVTAELDQAAEPLLREDTQLWVVRPRVGPGGVSGLGTLLSGGYIQLAPGSGAEGRLDFTGLDEPPITPTGTPGLHFHLVADHAGSVSARDPILYRGLRVGRIERAEFDLESEKMEFDGFIDAPYDELVSSATRFWNASGIEFDAGANGVHVRTASMEAVVIGGVEFGLPEGLDPGSPVESGSVFRLHRNLASVNEQPYLQDLEYVVRFPRSLRGLHPGAPVEYRGIRVGHVERILLDEFVAMGQRGDRPMGEPIPVLLRLQPGRFALADTEEGKAALVSSIEKATRAGMRASLATGSLLTGSLYVYLDVYPDEPPTEVRTWDEWPTIPAIESGLAGIERRVAAMLDKVNALPIESLLARAEQAITDLDRLLANPQFQEIPASLEAALGDLRDLMRSLSTDSTMQERLLRTATEADRTLQSLRQVLEALEEQPNALIFNREPGKDPRPPAGSP